MNLIFSYSTTSDNEHIEAKDKFLGVAEDSNGKEVHVFLKKGCDFANQYYEDIRKIPKLVIDDVEVEIAIKRKKQWGSDIAYHVVAGTVLLGQINKISSCRWEAQTFDDNPTSVIVSRRYMAVEYLIKHCGYEVRR